LGLTDALELGAHAASTSGSAIGLRFHGYEARKGTSVCSHSFDDAGALLAIDGQR
jgi:hypothetical protein